MFNTNILYIAIPILVIVGVILALVFSGKKRTDQLQTKFGPEYNHTVETLGDETKAQKELRERQKHVEALNIRPLTTAERDRYMTEWAAVQTKFVDSPGQAIITADHLIMEVMQLRDYPVANFEQRAADISVSYPALVTNYRAARVIALKNEQGQADTEELRKALIYYRSLFEELLSVVPEAV